jgi:hypothetical protein
MKSRKTETLSAGSRADREISPGILIQFGLIPIAAEDWLRLRAFLRKLTAQEKQQFLSQLAAAAEIVAEELELAELEKEVPVHPDGSNIYNFQADENNQR